MGSARGFWRWLTSMRTALMLLFVLAVAAIPGSLLPQRNVSPERVAGYLAEHPSVGPWLHRLWGFDVYASPWFASVYLLLFASLVGCLVPRLLSYLGALHAIPPNAPSRLERLPYAADGPAHDGDPASAAEWVRTVLRRRRWRTTVREHADGTVTVSAEKGYLKEAGNLLFHFSLLAILFGVATGSWYGWHANRLLVAGADFAFCNSLQQYDEQALGARVSEAGLPRFCLRLDSFSATYLDSGFPTAYTAEVHYTDPVGSAERPYRLEVNHPLRLDGANVYLLGHGYAPILRYTDTYGVTQTTVAPFPFIDGTLTSRGVAMFPDANVDPKGTAPGGSPAQVAFAGTYVPTVGTDLSVETSVHPDERNPALFLRAYEGNLGLDVGNPKSVYTLDAKQLDSGALRAVGSVQRLLKGESWRLPDGSTVEFLGTVPWISLSVRHDPGEVTVLCGAGAMLVGLLVSLTGRRRRVWARVVDDGAGRSLISLGGLPRGEPGGFGEEFNSLVEALGPPVPERSLAVKGT
jgi:cytochrome c biogenesis protein